MAYHEITGSRRYEYRYPSANGFTGWIDAGPASPDTLATVANGLTDVEYEMREVCDVADDAGVHVGRLIFSQLFRRKEVEYAMRRIALLAAEKKENT